MTLDQFGEAKAVEFLLAILTEQALRQQADPAATAAHWRSIAVAAMAEGLHPPEQEAALRTLDRILGISLAHAIGPDEPKSPDPV